MWRWFFSILRFLKNRDPECVFNLLWTFQIEIRSLTGEILMISGGMYVPKMSIFHCTTYTLKIGPFTNPKLWKPISPFYTFHYHDVQVGVTSRRIVRFQKFKHHYKRENVYFNIIPKTQIRPCAQKSLILTAWVTYRLSEDCYLVSFGFWVQKLCQFYRDT